MQYVEQSRDLDRALGVGYMKKSEHLQSINIMIEDDNQAVLVPPRYLVPYVQARYTRLHMWEESCSTVSERSMV